MFDAVKLGETPVANTMGEVSTKSCMIVAYDVVRASSTAKGKVNMAEDRAHGIARSAAFIRLQFGVRIQLNILWNLENM